MSQPDGTAPDGWAAPAGWGGPAQQPTQPPAPQQTTSGQPPSGPPPGSWGARPAELKPGVVPLRPLGLGEVLDGAVGVIRRYPRPALGLSTIVAVLSTLLNVLLLVTAFQPFLNLDQASLDSGNTASFEGALGGAAAGGALAVVVSLLAGAVLAGALAVVVGKAVLGEPISFSEAWSQVRPRLWSLLGLALLVLTIVYGVLLLGFAIGAVLLAAAGRAGTVLGVVIIVMTTPFAVYLYIRLALAPCVLVLEKTGIRTAMTRSGALVKGDWWRTFGILVLTLVIGLFVSQIVQLPFAVIGAGSPGDLLDPNADVLGVRSLVLSAIGGGIAAAVVSPFTAGVRALLYVDRRMRAEGLDVALAASAAAHR